MNVQQVLLNVIDIVNSSLPTPEYMIICKLDWYKSSDIDKHYLDAIGIYRVQKDSLDMHYITQWVKEKSTFKIWQKLQAE